MTKTATIPTAEIGRDEDNVEVIQAWLVQHIATRLAVAPDDIDLREPFSNYDMDSTQVLVLATEMEKWLQMRLSPTLLWNYPTIAALAERLAEDTAHLGKLQLPDASEE